MQTDINLNLTNLTNLNKSKIMFKVYLENKLSLFSIKISKQKLI